MPFFFKTSEFIFMYCDVVVCCIVVVCCGRSYTVTLYMYIYIYMLTVKWVDGEIKCTPKHFLNEH